MENIETNNPELQSNLKGVVNKFGLQRTVDLLKGFLNGRVSRKCPPKKVKLLITYIISQVSNIFEVEKDDLIEGTTHESREARMACYNLLVHFTSLSHNQIGKIFEGQKRRHVLYYVHKCDDYLSISIYNNPFRLKFDMLEKCVIEFLEKLT